MANGTNGATVQLTKEGTYTCEATNQHGSDMKQFPVEFTGESFYLPHIDYDTFTVRLLLPGSPRQS